MLKPAAAQGFGLSDFTICRVLGNVALVSIEGVADLRTAKKRLLDLAGASPGHYVAVSSKTLQIVGTAVNSEVDTGSRLDSACPA